ncbi:hypothetical protein [Pseudoduganella albidiflava]
MLQVRVREGDGGCSVTVHMVYVP